MKLKDWLPSIYSEGDPNQVFSIPLEESGPDCDACSMAVPIPIYKSALKCCTYQPFVANYLVGDILVRGSSEAKRKIRTLIEAKAFVLPLGLCPSPDYQFNFKYKDEGAFGNDESLLCGFYDKNKGACQIWRQRSSECTGFVCQSSHGSKGKDFWGQLGQQIFAIEMAWSQGIMLQKGFSWQEVEVNLEQVKLAKPGLSDQGKRVMNSQEWTGFWAHVKCAEKYYVDCFAQAQRLEISEDVSSAIQRELRVLQAKEYDER